MVEQPMHKFDFGGECVHRITRAEQVRFAKTLERHVTLTMVKISMAFARAGVVAILAISFILVNPDEQHQPHHEQKHRKQVLLGERLSPQQKREQTTEI